MKLKLLLFILSISFFSTASAAGSACQALFDKSEAAISRVDFVKFKTFRIIRSLRLQIAEADAGLSEVKLNKDFNDEIGRVMDLNNDALDLLEALSAEKKLFSTASQRRTYGTLKGDLIDLFLNQGFTRETVDGWIRARLSWSQRRSARSMYKPIGFLVGEQDSVQTPSVRTIGFNQNPLQERGYGRMQDPEPREMGANAPMGFVGAESSEGEIKKNPSIGFIQNEGVQDVNYRLSFVFDARNGVFIPVANGRQETGFH